jgi:hypothetical protein
MGPSGRKETVTPACNEATPTPWMNKVMRSRRRPKPYTGFTYPPIQEYPEL